MQTGPMNSGSRNSARIRQAKSSLWEFFQGLGKTFMLPVALLAFCGIMLGIGSSLSSDAVTDNLTFLKGEAFHLVFTWMANTGWVAFTFLPVLFAMAIPLGLAREDKGVAAFSGFVGFASMNLAVNFFLTAKGVDFEDKKAIAHYGIADVLGIQSIDTGLLGAVAVGIIVSLLHRRFRTQRMPDALAFFGGLRFVPIISALALSVVGLAHPAGVADVQRLDQGIGEAIGHTGVFGPFFFGMGEVLLRPIGLHHMLVAMFRFTDVGGAGTVCGEHVSGALNMFYAQLNCDAPANSDVTAPPTSCPRARWPPTSAGCRAPRWRCTTARGARCGPRSRRCWSPASSPAWSAASPSRWSSCSCSSRRGCTLIHAVLVGLGFLVAAVLGVFIGNTDGNVIDWLVFGILQGTTTKWYLVPVIAAVWFAVYYFLFRWAISRFDLKTPGREDPEDGQEGDEQKGAGQKESASGGGEGAPGDADAAPDAPKRELVAGKYDPVAILEALGGPDNIRTLDNCITRLRMTVEDAERLDEARLKKLGAVGVVTLDAHTVQVIIGPQVQSVKDALATLVQVR